MSAVTESWHDVCAADSLLHPGFRSNASLELNRRRRFHSLNSASESDHADVTAQWCGKAAPAMNEVLPGTTTKERRVPAKVPASRSTNSESVSNEIDESDLQYAKHDEERI
jgi:hypothetical protein